MKKIINIEMPKTSNQFGLFQLNNLDGIWFRFELLNDKPKLMSDMFVESEGENGYKNILENTKMHEEIQELLTAEIEVLI